GQLVEEVTEVAHAGSLLKHLQGGLWNFLGFLLSSLVVCGLCLRAVGLLGLGGHYEHGGDGVGIGSGSVELDEQWEVYVMGRLLLGLALPVMFLRVIGFASLLEGVGPVVQVRVRV
ncbi:unnamed protein product, partial [Discosporangium mesarthrocarpum]